MSAHLSPRHHQSLAAGDAKKQPHLGADPGRRTSSCFGGDHSSTKKPGPSAAKLALASFLGVIVLLAADASLAGAGAQRRLRRQYLHYVGGGPGGARSAPAWLSVPDRPNFIDDLLARWLAPGGSPCRDARTANISVPALDGTAARGEVAELGAGEIHEFTFWALDDAGGRRCLGGDYFEVDLSGGAWKSRPPVVDRGDGSYSVRLQLFASAFQVGRAKTEEEKAEALKQAFAAVETLEAAFKECSKGKPFFGGDSVGYLDIVLGPIVPLAYVGEVRFGIKLFDGTRSPLLEAWVERFAMMDAAKAVLPEVDKLIEYRKAKQARAAAVAAAARN